VLAALNTMSSTYRYEEVIGPGINGHMTERSATLVGSSVRFTPADFFRPAHPRRHSFGTLQDQ
jgi:hypothetical protein